MELFPDITAYILSLFHILTYSLSNRNIDVNNLKILKRPQLR